MLAYIGYILLDIYWGHSCLVIILKLQQEGSFLQKIATEISLKYSFSIKIGT